MSNYYMGKAEYNYYDTHNLGSGNRPALSYEYESWKKTSYS